MADRAPAQIESISDGRLRRGQAKREQILQAALRVVEQKGATAATGRSVAAEAGVAPTLIVYHFETVENMLSEALVMSNNRYIELARDAIDRGEDPLKALADMIAVSADGSRHRAVAEFQLTLQSSRNPKIRAALDAWWVAVEELLLPAVPDAAVRRATILAADGMFLRQAVPHQAMSRAEILEVLYTITGLTA